MQSAADLSRLIDDIYTASETGDGLLECLEAIREVLCATSAHLMHYAPVTNEVVIVHAQFDPTGVEAYQNYFYRVDPWDARLPIRAMSAGMVLPGTAVLSREELKKTEFYADFGRLFGVTRTLFGVTRHNADGSHFAVSLIRNDHQDEFGADAVAYLSLAGATPGQSPPLAQSVGDSVGRGRTSHDLGGSGCSALRRDRRGRSR